MPSFRVETPHACYDAIVERGILPQAANYLPRSSGKAFVITTRDVWHFHGPRLHPSLAQHPHEVVFFPGGEHNKRLHAVEALADQMVAAGGDRSSCVIAFGGGIVTDVGGFVAASFMRGIPVLQIPTTLLAQVDAALGGKTGVNLAEGKNLVGAFHQPLAVLIDPEVLATLPEREYRAGLYEIIKGGVIRDAELFRIFEEQRDAVIGQAPGVVDAIIAAKVRIKAEVVTADPKEGDLRRILNYGHTVGHALESETRYERLLHGEAVAFGMKAANEIAVRADVLDAALARRINAVIDSYGPIPALDGIDAKNLAARLVSDKKTVKGKVHFVLPDSIGSVRIVSGLDDALVLDAIDAALRGAAVAV